MCFSGTCWCSCFVCSFIGYRTGKQTVSLYSDKTVDFSLKKKSKNIGEVEIRRQRNNADSEIGSSKEKIGSDVIRVLNVNNITDILAGTVKGLWATKTSGAPGDQNRIRIRGINSIMASAEPLYIIDGEPVPVLNMRSMGVNL